MNSEHPNTLICPDKKIGDYHFSTGFLDLDAWRNTRKLRFLCCNFYADENIQITRKLAQELHSKKRNKNNVREKEEDYYDNLEDDLVAFMLKGFGIEKENNNIDKGKKDNKRKNNRGKKKVSPKRGRRNKCMKWKGKLNKCPKRRRKSRGNAIGRKNKGRGRNQKSKRKRNANKRKKRRQNQRVQNLRRGKKGGKRRRNIWN